VSNSEQQRYVITVGFDGSEGARRALDWAVDQARQRAAELHIVRSWTPGEFGSDAEKEHYAQSSLDDQVADLRKSAPGLEVTTTVERGHAAQVLLEQAKNADMLVVGSRGHGGFAGLLLGSVSQQVSTHDGAPVVVIVRR
jgi:nucleotide-binding universal stress UspA family protein